ncbi:MAG TPA: hypothetical protein VFL84_11570 [Gammaproteobacteria bacterium]|nr:hypothetical protein [Gammaproteobacteria bacterium]
MRVNAMRFSFVLLTAAVFAAGCARLTPDPRNPAPVKDSPQLLRVCYVIGDAAHLAVGDQVELSTSGQGRLRIRHIPREGNNEIWNGGEAVAVKAAILVEAVPGKQGARRFVPVGRFSVRVPDQGDAVHDEFDFATSHATANLQGSRFPECNVALGTDEVIIRGVTDHDRHDGDAVLR